MARKFIKDGEVAIVGGWQEAEFLALGWKPAPEGFEPDDATADEADAADAEADDDDKSITEDEIVDLTVKGLDELAERFDIDLSGCKNKGEKQQVIIDSLEEEE